MPDKPGVYFFLKGKQILYIGKATSLRDRTKSYFSKDLIHTRGPLVLDMAFKADRVKWEVADSVLEALILEANLIKKHQPYYNTKEKDDKSFNYVCITKEDLPRVILVRGKLLQEHGNFSHFTRQNPTGSDTVKNFRAPYAKVFGPYTSGSQLREALNIIRRIFPFLDDKSKNYIQFYQQINLVPDLGNKKLYLQNINNIKLFFSGKKKQILRNLKKEMKAYAKEREFEKAGEVKRQIFALQHINDVALLRPESRIVNSDTNSRIEAYDIAHMGGNNMVGVMIVIEESEANKNEYRKFNIRTQSGANDTGALIEVLKRRLTHNEWAYPALIVVDGGMAQLNAGRSVLEKMRISIPIVAVVKDDRHKAKAILGEESLVAKYKKSILLANSEAHRFAIAFHKKKRGKSFLPRLD